jgi:hypothetical protein
MNKPLNTKQLALMQKAHTLGTVVPASLLKQLED